MVQQTRQNGARIDRIDAAATDGSCGVGRRRLIGLEAPATLAGTAGFKAPLLETGLGRAPEGIIKTLPKFEVILFSNRTIFNNLCMIS
jgi:hypothetical protein